MHDSEGMADNSAEIAKLQAILNTGATSVMVDGRSVTYDLDSLRRQLRDLMADDPHYSSKRPKVLSVRLGGV